MWSYRDAKQQEHTKIEYTEIRRLINEGAITQDSLIKNQHIGEWVKAGETSFFIGQEATPEEKSKVKDQLPAQSLAAKSKDLCIWRSPYIIALTLSIAALLYPAITYLLEQRELDKLQVSVDHHKDLHHTRQQQRDRLKVVENKLQAINTTAEAKGLKVDWNLPIYQPLVDEETSLSQSLTDNFKGIDKEPEVMPYVRVTESNMSKILSLAHWLALGLGLPLLITVAHYYKGSRVLTNGFLPRSLLSLLHLVPGLNFLIYGVYSARWNIETAQRKNAFIYTLPLSLAGLTCSFLVYYHYAANPQYSLFTLCFVAFLWGIVHFRYIQMVNYHRRLLKLRS